MRNQQSLRTRHGYRLPLVGFSSRRFIRTNHPSKRAKLNEKRYEGIRKDFRADAKNNFSPVLAALIKKKHDKREPRLFYEELIAPKCCVSIVKFIAVTIMKVKILSLEVK